MRDFYFDDDNFELDDELSELLELTTEEDDQYDLLDSDYMKLEYKRRVQTQRHKELERNNK